MAVGKAISIGDGLIALLCGSEFFVSVISDKFLTSLIRTVQLLIFTIICKIYNKALMVL